MKITKTTLNNFRADFEKTVKALEEQYQVTIDLGSITYEDTKFTSRITVVTTEKIDGKSAEQIDFEKLCGLYGFKPSHYNVEFNYNGELFKLIGFNTRASSKPCRVQRVSDKRIGRMPTTCVKF